MFDQKDLLSKAEVLRMVSIGEIVFPQSTQRSRALVAFSVVTFLTTKEMQRELDITHPSTCVSRLRREGHCILTRRHTYTSLGGRSRQIACYEYVGLTGDQK
jgi:hypothetical protein